MISHRFDRLHIVFAGGGTGGHVFPIKSLIDYLFASHPDFAGKITRVGSAHSMESQVASQLENVSFVSFFSGKLRRENSLLSRLKNIRDLVFLFLGSFQALRFLLRYRVDVVFCKGGYAALPVVFAAAALRIPLVVHESDTRPGLVNRIASRFARYIFTAFPHVLPRAQVVGQILSDDLAHPTRLHNLDFDKYKSQTLVLVTGGSLGARILYEGVAQIAGGKDVSDFFFVVIGGKMNPEAKKLFAKLKNTHRIDFVSQKEFANLYQHCDLVITRAGTTSLAEQKLFGLRSIIVPLPVTHDQEHNARRYVQHHGDVMVLQDTRFIVNLQKSLLEFKNFKKPDHNLGDLLDNIRSPKKKIIDTLFSVVQ